MRHFFYFIVVILFISSCDEENLSPSNNLQLQMQAHSSNNEFYAAVPVMFGAISKGYPYLFLMGDIELYIDGSRVELDRLSYSFVESGVYDLKTLMKMSDGRTYEFDTTINIVQGPPIFGDPERGEVALFGVKAGANYHILTSSYYGSSAHDYEAVTIDESLKQQGVLKPMDFDIYPDIYDHVTTASGKMAIIYDNTLDIYDASLVRKHQLPCHSYSRPPKMFVNDEHVTLIFDSLEYVTLKTVDLNTGQMVKGVTQFVGVNDMKINEHFFLDESRIATYFDSPDNTKTLLMGTHIGFNVEFSKYFQPPVFINNVTPMSFGGYVINTPVTGEKVSILAVGESNLLKWSQTFTVNFQNYVFATPPDRIVVKELDGFIYIFFNNMRCVKLSADGQLIWDKYFHTVNARFEDVMITSNGEFIMIGTYLPYSNENIDYQKRTDVLFIRIDKDGFRVEM